MKNNLLSQLEQLVGEQSVSSTNPIYDCGNQRVIDLLANWLDSSGFNCHIQPLKTQSAIKKSNLIATLSTHSESLKDGLVLAGHTDTVPFNADLWHQDPLTIKNQDGKLYALGATDMKGFFPTAIAAVTQLQQRLGAPKRPITIIATADEESTMDGARMLDRSLLPNPRYAVIGEPTELKPIRLHKGIMMKSINIKGISGHSSNPQLGLNAMEVNHAVMSKLLEWRDQTQQQYNNPLFEVAAPTMNFGCIHGGDNPNRICGDCYMEFDLRPIPGMNSSELTEQLQQLLQPIAEHYNTTIEMTPLADDVEPFEQAPQSKLIEYVEQLSEPSGSVAFATEAPFLQQLGMETVVWGPGSINQAHSANEYIEYSQIETCIDLYAQLIERICY